MCASTFVRLIAPLGVVLFATASPLCAQPARVEVGVGYAAGATFDPFRDRGFASVGAGLRVASVGPLVVLTEVSALLRVSEGARLICPSVPGAVCDGRTVGDVGRVGLHTRVGRRNGTGAYALATAGGWVTRLSGDVFQNNRIIERGNGIVAGGVVTEIGAGTSLPFGDRRTAIEARVGWFEGFRPGRGVRLALTRRW